MAGSIYHFVMDFPYERMIDVFPVDAYSDDGAVVECVYISLNK